MGKRKSHGGHTSANKKGRMKHIDCRMAGLRKHATLLRNTVMDPCRGFLISCDSNADASALGQAMTFALGMMKLLFPDAQPVWPAIKSVDELDVDLAYVGSDEAATPDDAEQGQGEALADMKRAEASHGTCAEDGSTSSKEPTLKRPDRLFQVVNAACAGLLFLRFRNDVLPLDFYIKVHDHIQSLPDEMQSKLLSSVCYTKRWLPIHATCPATIPDIVNTIKPMVSAHPSLQQPPDWDGQSQPVTFAVLAELRNCPAFDKKQLIEHVATCIPKWCKVDLSKPDYVALVSVFKHAAGLSILPDYHTTYHKYNIHSNASTLQADVTNNELPN
ncbi:hypothetical protein SeMB42_g07147 [Synchytrium endobioticum]|uniref:THUMP domain-containing protein n=1 Tax=Synchytrium endobioticum TaxID=286115 RepID=A0A507DGN5_9FUNG|nr:hypothetical protein SeMB42_g07147 [Synchytrium endobioticum]TPX50773.1 hypothetical protein SeLEV6574_g00718 [Synchytrium endobioticum]